MMKATLLKGKEEAFFDFLSKTSVFEDEISLTIKKDGTFSCNFTDQCQVLGLFSVSEIKFFEVKEEFSCNLEIPKLLKILNKLEEPIIEIEENKIRIKSKESEIEIPNIVDLDMNKWHEIKTPFVINYLIQSNDFKNKLSIIKTLGNNKVACNLNNSFSLSLFKDPSQKVNLVVDSIPIKKEDEPIFSIFNLDYLEKISKVIPQQFNYLLIGKNSPLKLTFFDKDINYSIVLAPVIDL